MEDILLSVLNMSLTASYVIVAIILVRLFLKKAPKVISYALWAVAGFRLVFPFSFESVFSLMLFKSAPIPADIAVQPIPRVDSGIMVVDNAVSRILPVAAPVASVNPLQIWQTVGAYLWLVGIAALLIYSVVSIILLKRQLRGAMFTERNIYEAGNLKTPFVLGFIRPKIYIPAGLSAEERSYIILHEQTHIRRFDHVVKLFAFLVLCVHWFNPLVWIAFILMTADMEMSCDECVLKEMGSDIKKAYSSSLLSMATGQRLINGSPLAFGEGNIKGRIKNVLNFKKPAAWVIAVSVVLVAALSIGFAANHAENNEEPDLSLLTYKNLAVSAYQMENLFVSAAPGKSAPFYISARAAAEYLDEVNWTIKKMDSPLELSPDIRIEWDENLQLRFYESNPLLTMVSMNEQWRYYNIGEGDYEKMLSLLETASISYSAGAAEKLTPTSPKLSPDQPIGIGMPQLDYADDNIVIFHGDFGMFVYDLKTQTIIRSLDLGPIGCGQTQGSDACEVEVSKDGGKVFMRTMETNKMYIWDLTTKPDLSLSKASYDNDWPEPDERFSMVSIETAISTVDLRYSYSAADFGNGEYGYLHATDWTLGTLTYVRSSDYDTEYKLFNFNATDTEIRTPEFDSQ